MATPNETEPGLVVNTSNKNWRTIYTKSWTLPKWKRFL